MSASLGPRFQAVLASAWISKREAAKYVQEYVKRVQKADPKATADPLPFAPPIQVQVLDIAPHAAYEPLDAINGGEDSLFHARNKQNLSFGVSDGVGGWNESGIDPSIFSRTLTAYSTSVAQEAFLLHDSDEIDPRDVIRRAFAGMRMDGVPAYGSATALAMNLSLASGRLRTAQLGDSTYVILDGKQQARFVSAEQQHRFNMPFQLTIPPLNDEKTEAGGSPFYRPRTRDDEMRRLIDEDEFADLAAVGFDTPLDARPDAHTMHHGDVVVAATDGLFDNVRVDEVEKLAERFMQAIHKTTATALPPGSEDARPVAVTDLFGGLAYSVAAQAVANYIQDDLRSPFAERAKLAGYSFTGGKPDDVTVMLAWVRETAKVEAEAKIAAMSAKL
ncbi:Protein phosphatase 2C 7 [Kickxella alabastrina]|uniref:Protein phosphatase 2C 7 n=1 Tax=Kickxella alabastrina TaxID=61397 RepID=A0ACC1I4N1_9FUNG|nr:Protein phosphatase 2C 7 [Kickxella alabastrina]